MRPTINIQCVTALKNLFRQEPVDHTRCKAKEGERTLIFAQKTGIRSLALDRKVGVISLSWQCTVSTVLQEMSAVVSNTRSACALDFDWRTGRVFYSDIIEEKIFR